MVQVALLARLVAKTGKEEEFAAFLSGALSLAQAEPATTVWFALRLSKSEFGIFDAFPSDTGRKAHLNGPIAAALMAKAGNGSVQMGLAAGVAREGVEGANLDGNPGRVPKPSRDELRRAKLAFAHAIRSRLVRLPRSGADVEGPL